MDFSWLRRYHAKKKDFFKDNLINILPTIILLAYLVIGSVILPDYGISMDEPIQRKHGLVSFGYINEKFNLFPKYSQTFENLPDYDHREYGVVFQLICYCTEQLLHLENPLSVFILRHIFTFLLFWLSAVYFYKVVEIQFGKGIISVLGLLFYILSPRIFAEAFYNPKDIILLSWISIGLYTMVNFIEQKTLKYLLLHAFICALAVNARVVGIILPFTTLVFCCLVFVKGRILNVIKIFSWIIITLLLIYFFWPFLWENPITNFIYSFNEMKQFSWNGQLLYWGKLVWSSDLPWHYILSEVLVTTPLLYVLLFIIGLFYSIKKILIFEGRIRFNLQQSRITMFLILFMVPLISVIYFHSILYNGWRQMYFIYPAFLIIALVGLDELFNKVKLIKNLFFLKMTQFIFFIVMSLSISSTILFLIEMHPYQYIYFNRVAGNEPLKKFDGDYFGLSYKQAFKYLLKNFPNDTLKINVTSSSGIINIANFNGKDSERLKLVTNIQEADFYVTTFYYPSGEENYLKYWNNQYPFNEKLMFMKEFRDSKIIGVYALKQNSVSRNK